MLHAKQKRRSVLIKRPRIPQMDARRDLVEWTRREQINLGLIMQSDQGNQLYFEGEKLIVGACEE